MGICQSEEEKRNQAVDEQLVQASKQFNETYKLLLLGTGESGKSTVFKQFVCLYGPGFSRDYRLNAIPSIHSQIIKTIKTMIVICERQKYQIHEDLLKSKEVVEKLDESDVITQEIAWHIGNVWNDPNVRKGLIPQPIFLDQKENVPRENENSLYHYFPDSTEYFFKQLHAIADSTYVPSNADLFRVRIPTTGILETEFVVKGVKFLLVDVGGQRNERRKWINSFNDVKAVLYVVAISEYDQQLYEETRVNRVRESLQVFKKIAREQFPNTTIIVFLNKADLFREKIKFVPFKRYFSDYDGPEHDADMVIKHFQKMFIAEGRNENSDRRLYFQVTCATDTKAAKKIFDAVKDTVITEHLKNSSLLV